MNLNEVLVAIIAWFSLWIIVIIKQYFQELRQYWKEPVLNNPVLIIESDDWGVGPPKQQEKALVSLAELLSQYVDKFGRHPVMTLGVIFSVPDAEKIKKSNYQVYYAKSLDQSALLPVKNAMLRGVDMGLFALQLHGMAHYWPDNLMRSLNFNEQIKKWLDLEEFPRTEFLPSLLQSRWINTESLPTRSLEQEQIREAVAEEVVMFEKIFGFSPDVVVPPTFVWNEIVEKNWKRNSISYLVTPGQCFDYRDKEAKPCGKKGKIVNGQLSKTGLVYLVRNDYFEPSIGHTAESALSSLEKKTLLRQPTLLETHRFNFIKDDETLESSLNELDKVISLALEKYPDLIFLSTKELGDIYHFKNKILIERSHFIRFLVYIERIWSNSTIRKWLYLSGLFIPIMTFKTIIKNVKKC